jgi:iron complex outermembrane receptor protein
MEFISLGYTFERLLSDRVSLKASAVLQNAFLITGYKGQDPETASGVSSYSYPRARTASLELSLDF